MMRARTLASAGLASLLLHAAAMLVIANSRSLHFPFAPLPMEVRSALSIIPLPPPQRGAPLVEAHPAQPPPVAHDNPIKVSEPGSRPRPRPKAATPKTAAPSPPISRPPPPAVADLRRFAPGDAKLVVLLRTDRLRTSSHRVGVESLLSALPDYATFVSDSGLSAIDDFDALLIATANPLDVTATFLAARHADDARIHDALSARNIPPWDPRRLSFPSATLSVLSLPFSPRPSVASRAAGDGGVVAVVKSAELEAETLDRWLADLARFEAIADGPGSPALLLDVTNVGALVRLEAGLPTPLSLALAASADPSPSVTVRAEFATEAEATRFARQWPSLVDRFRVTAMFIGLSSLLDGIKARRDGTSFELSGTVAESQLRLALGYARAALPRNNTTSATASTTGSEGSVSDGGRSTGPGKATPGGTDGGMAR